MTSNQAEQALSLDLTRTTYLEDPYQLYRQLRETDPVHWDPAANAWVLTRYADVIAALRDPRMTAVRPGGDPSFLPEELRTRLGPAVVALTRQLLSIDPPDHTRLRGLVNRAFTPRMVESWRARSREIVEHLVDEMQERQRVEFIADFAERLPVTIIAEMLGVPSEDHQRFVAWTNDFATLLDGGDFTFETLVRSLTGVADLMDYLRGVLADHRAHPRDDLLQAFIAAEERGDTLSEDEVLSNCVLLLAAGNGTTTHLLGNGLLALIRNPDQMRSLREHLDLMPGAVQELLRYDGPVQLTSRRLNPALTEPMQLGGKPIAPDQMVIPVLGAANHDPAVFHNPDALNVSRTDSGKNVAFGHGIHYCLGAPLARLEGEEALTGILRRFSTIEITDEGAIEHFPSSVFRGLVALPLEMRD